MNYTYQEFKSYLQKIADFNNLNSLAGWDQEVMMPNKAMEFRARQMATVSGHIHDLFTNDEFLFSLHYLKKQNNLNRVETANIIETSRILEKKKKLPTALVELESRTISQAYQSWLNARSEDKFKTFLPKLKEIIDIQKKKADLQGYDGHPYDALLDDYEPGLTTESVDNLFTSVKTNILNLVKNTGTQTQPEFGFLHGKFDKESQIALCKKIITDLGYDWETGRIDLSEHPFSISFNPFDVRITTRVNENDIQECLWGAIHETGHALYELGLPPSEYGLPSGSPASLSIHESQSRFWENNIGKSFDFIKAYFPLLTQFFPDQFKKRSGSDFFKGLNIIKPDLIRINSDEVTYHLHILLRYEIEKDLIAGALKVEDIEEVWNDKVFQYLGLTVPSPKKGVLQDIHWSHGSFGYFPTYSLGSFYAAQFYYAAEKSISDLSTRIFNKDYTPILNWLRENIHCYGHSYSSEEICIKATGESLNFKYFYKYILKKYSMIYNLSA
jgi:carboxypeptidase Taq